MLYITNEIGHVATFKKTLKTIKGGVVIILGGFKYKKRDIEEKIHSLDINDFEFCFIDSDNDNYAQLNDLKITKKYDGIVGKLSNNISYLLRGNTYNIMDTSFFAMGGGPKSYSLTDIGCIPTKEEINNAIQNLNNINNKVDYILTFIPPRTINDNLIYRLSELEDDELKNNIEHNQFCNFLNSISKTINYKKWFFGNMNSTRLLDKKFHSVGPDIITLK